MKTQNTMTKRLLSTAAVAAMSVSSLFAQANLGTDCGCPSVASRPTVLLSTLADANGDLTSANTILSCDKTWILDKKIYVPASKTLTIEPGTVIKGRYQAVKADATALIVERDAKIFASGTEKCQIVFTAEDDNLDGTYPIANSGKWGGVVILGKAKNNLIVGNAYSGGTDGVGFIEGFSAANSRDLYGGTDDDDNSGILRYVSIRHSGTQIADANELNGLSLGSVGRGTQIDHIEIISSDDDNVEIFGGTVNLKYITTMYGADDMLDYDLGWTGKAQFIFGVADPSNSIGQSYPGSSDNGFEMDADDDKKSPALKSHPIIYNATFIGNGIETPTADNSGPAAIQAKELTQGEIYNSVFAGFRSGLHLATGRSTATYKGDAYDNWTDADNSYNDGVSGGNAVKHSLIIKNNTFIGNTYKITTGALTTGKNPAVLKIATLGSAADSTQFYADGNLTPASIPGFTYTWAFNNSTNATTTAFDAIPASNLASTIVPPTDGFFTPVAYRGAFDASKPSWLSGWSYAALLKTTAGLQDNPTDINKDGKTDLTDFNMLVAKYGQLNK